MDKFIEEASQHGITTTAIKEMVERDVQYKLDLYNKMKWMRTRQIVTIFIASGIFIIMALILYKVHVNSQNMKDLITVLLGFFMNIDTGPVQSIQ